MSFEIQEIDGKLFKITSQPIDAHNVKREATPLTEDEYDKLLATLQGRQKEEIDTMARFKGSKTLLEKAEKDERDVTIDEPVRGKEIHMKSSPQPKAKRFRVSRE